MCKLIRIFLLSALVLSCQKPLFETPPRSEPSGNGSRRDSIGILDPDAPEPPPDFYATALCFGEGEPAQVVLFKNGEEVLRVPVSGHPEPERHRLLNGHLWTDTCDGTEVVISRDGEERFRYPGDELFRGFLEVKGKLYTLGQRQGKEGFSFRVNGEERFSAPTGTILGGPEDNEWEGGAFSQDTSGVYYTYGIPLWKGEELLWEYRVMQEDQVYKTLPAGSADAIYDIRVHNGIVYRSELRSSIRNTFCLVKDETYQAVELSATEVPHYWKLTTVNGQILLKGYSTGILGGKEYSYWLRTPSEVPFIVTDNQPIREMVTDGEHVAYLVENTDGLVRAAYLDKAGITFTSDRYRLPSSRCIQLKKGVLGLALSSPDGQKHLLIRDREVQALQFNGYFTSVQIY